MSKDTIISIKIKLYIKDGQTEGSIQDIIQDIEYYFDHKEVQSCVVEEVIDTHISSASNISSDESQDNDTDWYERCYIDSLKKNNF